MVLELEVLEELLLPLILPEPEDVVRSTVLVTE
jgi:hypothetical protein